MLVRFSDQNEFVAELSRDPHAIARKLVRTTTLSRPAMNGAITQVIVVGSAKVISEAAGADLPGGYDLVEYSEYAGDLWGHGAPSDDETQERANRLVKELEGKLIQAGFVVGHGRYENEEVVKRG